MSNKDELSLKGVMSEGYGIIPKKVMKDKDLSIEAKAIYSFMASYSGNGNTAFPTVEYITDFLGISRQRFNKHRKLLEEKGYVTVTQERKEGSQFTHNIYTLEFVPTLGFATTEKPTTEKPTTEKPTTENITTNNNTSNNNTNKTNSLQESNVETSGNPTAHTYKEIVEYLNDKAEKKYRDSTQKTKTVIQARYKEGFELEDFKSVIDIKVKEWKGTDMDKFLRPETLFGPKFESYLNQKEVSNNSRHQPSNSNYDGWKRNKDVLKAREEKYMRDMMDGKLPF